jgi:hypothetical protein
VTKCFNPLSGSNCQSQEKLRVMRNVCSIQRQQRRNRAGRITPQRWLLLGNGAVIGPSYSWVSVHCDLLLTIALSCPPCINLGHTRRKTLPPTVPLLLAYVPCVCVCVCVCACVGGGGRPSPNITWQQLLGIGSVNMFSRERIHTQ